MHRIFANSSTANSALALVSGLQKRFLQGLRNLSVKLGKDQIFSEIEWFRDEGRHGGGIRFETADGPLFGRGSVNVSQVHYDDMAEKKLGSANAISTIIHPAHPLAPSVHIHISWTEMKDGKGYWRIMADLNPSHEVPEATARFLGALEQAAPEQFSEAINRGERYFYIPLLGRHRGVAHFYLENYNTGDSTADMALAQSIGATAIDTYLNILETSLCEAPEPTSEQRATQIAYHTLYFFQVLTLDRGTTTGLLVHNQNDVGIMGSLPAYVDRNLLNSWVERMQAPQDKLLKNLVAVLPRTNPAFVDEQVKRQLADVVRQHYTSYPEAIAMQASAEKPPPTIQNHA